MFDNIAFAKAGGDDLDHNLSFSAEP
jgi:hypothetical protein